MYMKRLVLVSNSVSTPWLCKGYRSKLDNLIPAEIVDVVEVDLRGMPRILEAEEIVDRQMMLHCSIHPI